MVGNRQGREKPSQPKAPPWSWVAMEGPITFNLHHYRARPLVILLQVDSFKEGGVEMKSLQLRGKLRPASLNPHHARENTEPSRTREVFNIPFDQHSEGAIQQIGKITFDTPEVMPINFDCLLLCYDITRYSGSRDNRPPPITATPKAHPYS